jgi:hypothetical protein
LLLLATLPAPSRAADTTDTHGYTEDIGALPDYLHDRGAGVTTTQFATYVRKGEWLVYTYYEYDGDKDKEYKPLELGFNQDQDYFSKEIAQAPTRSIRTTTSRRFQARCRLPSW